MLKPVIIAQTFKQFPTGGVHAPTANPITKITPNSIGEIPMYMILGKKTGVKSKMAGLTSINVPDIKIIIANNKSMLAGFRPKVDIVSDIWSGILSYANIHINNFEKAMIIIILALVKTESFSAL